VPAAIRDLDGAPEGWRDLLDSDPGATPAHRPALWAAFATVLPGYAVRFLEVRDVHGLLGGMPVLVERRAGFHALHAGPLLLSGAPLARAGAHGEVDEAAGKALAGLQRERRAIGGEWSLYRPGDPPPPARALEAPGGVTRTQTAAVVELAGGLEAAWRRVERIARQEIRGARALTCGEEPGALAEAYTLHVAQSRSWGGHRPLPLELSRRLLADGGDGLGPAARLFTARDPRGTLLCAALVLDHPREAMPWWSGARPEARRRHAFARLLWTVVEWAHAGGRARVNLGASAGLDAVASFKRTLGARAETYPVRWLDARAAGPAGRALAALQARLRARRAPAGAAEGA
jgi:hypothetical protein